MRTINRTLGPEKKNSECDLAVSARQPTILPNAGLWRFIPALAAAAVEEERLNRTKHWAAFPSLAIRACLDTANLTLSDIDFIAFNSNPYVNLHRKIAYTLAHQRSVNFIKSRFKNTRVRLNAEKDFDFIRPNRDAFLACDDESIDYAVMEKTDAAVLVPLDAGWSDVGSYAALWDISDKDENNNVKKGDVISVNSKNCYLHSKSKLISTVGVENLVVVDTPDAVLIADKDKVQEIKSVVKALKEAGRHEAVHHRDVYRPWGVYDSIDSGERFQVKHITVKPGAKLSVQMHHHRAEHWVVVSGSALVTIDEKTTLLTENQSCYIPIGAVHALENPGKLPLELIEVQSGSYLGEDDIVRFEDKYGRAN